ncbi:MAG: tRNA dihydrouridine synthase DusB [Ruminococcaceae bacterium]|nr:tRNA dihydrouridine synthase DusB [Oscillospiraceae bacterium]
MKKYGKIHKKFFIGNDLLKIGNVKFNSKAFLAPMAGVADMAFRELCVEYGAGYVESEMVSSKGITMTDRKSKELLHLSEKERPAGIQIFGYDPFIMAQSIETVMEFKPEIIDINMGCPAPKIVNNKSGSSLLRNPALAESIVKEVVNASPVPVTVKMRAGWDNESINAVEIAKRVEQAGASAIIIHGRTREQMYALPINFDIIKQVKQAVNIPVIGNGDITDGLSAAKMIEYTNCDAVMVGRGSLGRPWVFSQINGYLNHETVIPEPPVSERMRVMLKHINRICEYKGERIGIREARKHAAWYTKGIRGTARYKREICSIESIEQLEEIAFRIASENQ